MRPRPARRDDARHGRVRSVPAAEDQPGHAPHSGGHGDRPRPAFRPRARAGSGRRRLFDQADPRPCADRARALAGAAQDGDRRAAHACGDLARDRHRIAGTRGGPRFRPRRARAHRRRSPGVLRARRGGARRGARRRGRGRPERSAVPRRRRQFRSVHRLARAGKFRCAAAVQPGPLARPHAQYPHSRHHRARQTTRAWCAASRSA